MKMLNSMVVLAALLLLVACGGGGGGSSSAGPGPTTPVTPTVGLPGLITASAIGDLNGDALADLVIGSTDLAGDAQASGGSDLLLINRGSDSFERIKLPAHYRGTGGTTVAIKMADLNGDSSKDLMTVTVANDYASCQIQLYLNDGRGNFTDATSQVEANTYSGWFSHLDLVDVDGDGKLDVVLSTWSGAQGCLVYQGDGKGHFTRPTITFSRTSDPMTDASAWTQVGKLAEQVDVGSFAFRPAFRGDFNGDGSQDFFDCKTNSMFYNKSVPGKFAFTVSPSNVTYTSTGLNGLSFIDGVVLDVTGDGRPDLVVSACNARSQALPSVPVLVLHNNGDGTFTERTVTTFGTASQVPQVKHARQFLVADLDGDGSPEILIADHGYDDGTFPGAPNLLLSVKGGTLSNVSTRLGSTQNGYTHGAAIGDLNGDGKPDLFLNNTIPNGTTTTSDPEARFWRNQGDGTFKAYSPAFR